MLPQPGVEAVFLHFCSFLYPDDGPARLLKARLSVRADTSIYGTLFALYQHAKHISGMTQEQFNQLSKTAQRNLLLTAGTFLDERQSRNHDVMLYELDGFYAEAYFVKNTNKAVFFKSFTNTDLLEPYLKQVDITELVSQAFH